MGVRSLGQSRRNETLFDSVARYRRTGMATMPKLMAPRHMERGMVLSSIGGVIRQCPPGGEHRRPNASGDGKQQVVGGFQLRVAQEDDVGVFLGERLGL